MSNTATDKEDKPLNLNDDNNIIELCLSQFFLQQSFPFNKVSLHSNSQEDHSYMS